MYRMMEKIKRKKKCKKNLIKMPFIAKEKKTNEMKKKNMRK